MFGAMEGDGMGDPASLVRSNDRTGDAGSQSAILLRLCPSTYLIFVLTLAVLAVLAVCPQGCALTPIAYRTVSSAA